MIDLTFSWLEKVLLNRYFCVWVHPNFLANKICKNCHESKMKIFENTVNRLLHIPQLIQI